jgi:hypothetical protein
MEYSALVKHTAKRRLIVKLAEKDERTFPISRTMTNPGGSAALAATQKGLGGAALAGGLGFGVNKLRAAAAKGDKGAAELLAKVKPFIGKMKPNYAKLMVGGALTGAAGSALLRVVRARAARGRARQGQEGVLGSEKRLLRALRASGETEAKGRSHGTNPLSRAVTSASGTGLALGGLSAAAGGAVGGLKGAALMGLIGGGTGYGLQALGRAIHARAARGRARTGYAGGLGSSDALAIRALKRAGDKG